MLALSNGLANLTRGTEVTVNTILGGLTYSDGVASTVSGIAVAQGITTEDLKAAIIGGNRTSLLERFITPNKIANLALNLDQIALPGFPQQCPLDPTTPGASPATPRFNQPVGPRG